jgi:hypothetical protein
MSDAVMPRMKRGEIMTWYYGSRSSELRDQFGLLVTRSTFEGWLSEPWCRFVEGVPSPRSLDILTERVNRAGHRPGAAAEGRP